MAVTVTNIQDGPRTLVVWLYIAADNADAVVVDASALAGAPTRLSLIEAQWALTGAAATLEWDQTTDAGLLEMTVGNGFILPSEGVKNVAGAGTTGDVMLTNAAELTSGSVYLKFNKT